MDTLPESEPQRPRTSISGAVIKGHLLLTLPALAAVCLLPFLAYRAVGPNELIYATFGSFALAWQFRVHQFQIWKGSLMKAGLSETEVAALARRCGLAFGWEDKVSSFALHTSAAAMCAFHVGPWLVGRWFAWIIPLTGQSNHSWSGDFWMQHFEPVSMVPAAVAGYFIARFIPKLSLFAWLVPTFLLAIKLITYSDGNSSVLSAHSMSSFRYFFEIHRSMPRWDQVFNAPLDVVRTASQIGFVAPFYGGIGYALGSVFQKYKLLARLKPAPPEQPGPETDSSDHTPVGSEQSF